MRRPIEDLDPQFQGKILPRHDLREPAFRRYENCIAKAATQRQLILSFLELPMGLTGKRASCKTFVARFADAKLGYKRYGYKSYLIPKNFDVDNLVAYEMTQDSVVIRNYALSTAPIVPILSSDHETIMRIIRDLPNWLVGSRVTVKLVDAADYDWLRSLESAHNIIVYDRDDNDFASFAYSPPTPGLLEINDPDLAAQLKAMNDEAANSSS